MGKQDQTPRKYCTPVMLAQFVGALFGFKRASFLQNPEKNKDVFCWLKVLCYKHRINNCYRSVWNSVGRIRRKCPKIEIIQFVNFKTTAALTDHVVPNYVIKIFIKFMNIWETLESILASPELNTMLDNSGNT